MKLGWVISFLAGSSMAPCLFGLPPQLADTGLYSDFGSKTVDPSNRPYVPQYPLYSDGALKERWIYLPENQKIDVTSPDRWNFPIGTKIWKEFSLRDASGKVHRIETRLAEKSAQGDWEFGTYLWNAAESNAVLAPEAGVLNYAQTSAKTSYDIPSVAECLRCHKRGGDPILGFEAIQLSIDRDPNALHAEPLKTNGWTLKHLIEQNRLSANPPEFAGGAPKIHASSPLTRTALGYLHSNCASCHNPFGAFPHIGMDLRHSLKATNPEKEPAFATTVNRFTTVVNLPGQSETYRVKRGDPNASAMHRLMIEKTSHMPPLGANLPDKLGIALIKDWISKL